MQPINQRAFEGIDQLPAPAGVALLWQGRLADELSDRVILHRQARALAERHDIAGAIKAFATALSLPPAASAKHTVVEDFAVYAAYLRATGGDDALGAENLLLALAANVDACRHAAAWLGTGDAASGRGGLPPDAIAAVQAYLGFFVDRGAAGALSPYPTVDGRPHVDIVWLEITNYCNQKCTFCPDMHREDARTWLPLEKVKQTIDQLLEGVSVGSMQLNAYGEPLLHPDIKEILEYIREKELPWPVYFTSHGLTLVAKKLKQLSHNYPQGIAISLHNDGQMSYDLTRTAKIGDYDLLVSRTSALFRQMVNEQAPTHLRLYQMISNGQEDQRVDADTRRAFPDTADRLLAHVRKWEAIARDIADQAPPVACAIPLTNDEARIRDVFDRTVNSQGIELPILNWIDVDGQWQQAFMSTRPVGTYANLLLEYDDRWQVGRNLVNPYSCGFVAKPSLAIFATGRLGICCLDMNSTATFASLDDFPDIASALTSPQAATIFAELANGIATSRGCQICLSSDTRRCAS